MSPVQERQLLTSGKLIPMSLASKLTPYSTEYLSLLARKGRLPAVKISRDWLTTEEQVKKYLKEQQKKHAKMLGQLSASLKSQSGFVKNKTLIILGAVAGLVLSFSIFFAAPAKANWESPTLYSVFTNGTSTWFGHSENSNIENPATLVVSNPKEFSVLSPSLKLAFGRLSFAGLVEPYLELGNFVSRQAPIAYVSLAENILEVKNGWQNMFAFYAVGFENLGQIQTQAFAEQMAAPNKLIAFVAEKSKTEVMNLQVAINNLPPPVEQHEQQVVQHSFAIAQHIPKLPAEPSGQVLAAQTVKKDLAKVVTPKNLDELADKHFQQ